MQRLRCCLCTSRATFLFPRLPLSLSRLILLKINLLLLETQFLLVLPLSLSLLPLLLLLYLPLLRLLLLQELLLQLANGVYREVPKASHVCPSGLFALNKGMFFRKSRKSLRRLPFLSIKGQGRGRSRTNAQRKRRLFFYREGYMTTMLTRLGSSSSSRKSARGEKRNRRKRQKKTSNANNARKELWQPSDRTRRRFLSLSHPLSCPHSPGGRSRQILLCRDTEKFCFVHGLRVEAKPSASRASIGLSSNAHSCSFHEGANPSLRHSSPSLAATSTDTDAAAIRLRARDWASAVSRGEQEDGESRGVSADSRGLQGKLRKSAGTTLAVSTEHPEEGRDSRKRETSDKGGAIKKEGNPETKADFAKQLRQTQAEIAEQLTENALTDPDIDTVLLNFQELKPDAVAEDFLRDLRLALRHLLSTSRREDLWAVAAVESLVKGLLLTLDREIVAHQNYIHQLEHLVVSHQSREAELLSVQLRNQELQCLVDSVKRLKQEEKTKHEQEQAALRQQIEKLVNEIDRLTPNEEAVERTRDLMADVEEILETHSSECMHQQDLLQGLTHTLASLVVGKGESVAALRDKRAGRVVELANGELEFRVCDMADAEVSLHEEDLGCPDLSTPVKLRWKFLRRLFLKYRAADLASVSLPDLLCHIERIYDFKTSQEFSFVPSSEPHSASYREGKIVSSRPRPSLLDAWREFEVEEFGLVSQAEKKIARVLSALSKLIHQAGENTDNIHTELQLFVRFLGFCELSSYYPPPVLSVFLFVRQQCSRWRKEKVNSLSVLLRARQQQRKRNKQLELEQEKLLQEVMKEKRLEFWGKQQVRTDSRVSPPAASLFTPDAVGKLVGDKSVRESKKSTDRPASSLPSFLSHPASLHKKPSFSSSAASASSSSSSSSSAAFIDDFFGQDAARVEVMCELKDAKASTREDEDLRPPPQHLVSASVGFAAAVEGLRGLPARGWGPLLDALCRRIVLWNPSASPGTRSGREDKETQEGEAEELAHLEESGRDLEEVGGGETATLGERKKHLLLEFLRDKFVNDFPESLEQRRKETRLARKRKKTEETVPLQLSHAEVEMVGGEVDKE
ncbi:UNVERIFIED_CONTAM: hypothetical protein HHA_297488 [Hammondia hammondi]|eukprot:XP_008886103.1 hypothetical protein HHA_297488 [Hammondia hammondi]